MKYKSWSPIVIVFDPHNEYAQAFPGLQKRLSTDEGTLNLPYWFLTFQELLTLIMGRSRYISVADANIVKRSLWAARREGAKTIGMQTKNLTIDSPIPYSFEFFKQSIENWRSIHNSEVERAPYDAVLDNIDVIEKDSRLRFMMHEWEDKTDPIIDVLYQFVGEGPPLRIMDLSGVPNEIAGLASAVVARTLFNVKLWQSSQERNDDPILLVCEEAHRYVPNRGEAQYETAQEAIRRLAKEGRKYGLGLMLVSQRPSEIEGTVLSQCNSWILLRISNEVDLNHVRAILPDTLEDLSRSIAELRQQEAIFVGQAAVIPSRIKVRTLTPEQLPRSNDISFDKGWQSKYLPREVMKDVAERWRTQLRIHK